MRKIRVSSPGKLLILGEHSVVYDRPSIVTTVDTRVFVTLKKNKKNKIIINAPEVGIKNYQRDVNQPPSKTVAGGVRFLEAVLKIFYERYQPSSGVTVTTRNGFSSKYGLGSSSAVSVCTVKALAEIFGKKLSKRKIFDLAYQAVLDVQGVGSGFDVAACCFGGVLYYWTAGKKIVPLKVSKIPLVVAYSGHKADTPLMIRKLEVKREKHFKKIENWFDQITKLVEQGKKAIEKKNWKDLGKIMNQNHQILQKLGVSTRRLNKMVKAALDSGAFGAKLSGSGGGDCMIALVDKEKRHQVEQTLVEAGGILVPVSTGVEGVRIENHLDNPEELFVVVDKEDNVLGYAPRSKCQKDPSLIHRVIGVVIFNKKGKVLLQKRSQKKDNYPGFYTISASGHVAKGENYQESAKREMQEEIGIKIPLRFFSKFITREEKETEMNVLFKAKSEGPFSPNKDEVEELGFFSKREIKNLAMQGKLTPFAKKSLEKIGVL